VNFSKTNVRHEVRNVSIRVVNSWSIKTHTHTYTSRQRKRLSSQLGFGRTDKCEGYQTIEIRVQPCGGQSSLIHIDCDTVD